MGDTALNVPIQVRTHEFQQVKNMVPRVEERVRDAGRDDEADELHRINDEHIGDSKVVPLDGTNYLSMPADDWRTVMRHLDRLSDEEGLRTWWLRKKLASRFRDRLEELEGGEE